jgi:hypothetical protein
LKNSRFFVREGVFSVKKIAEKKDKKGLLKEGIKKVWDTFTKKKVNPYWFLFNDLLVYCDFKSSVSTALVSCKNNTDFTTALGQDRRTQALHVLALAAPR